MKLIIPKPDEPQCQPDPFILKSDGRYYIYSTHRDGVQVYSADSLLFNWCYEGVALRVNGQHEYWAPCVTVWEGQFYMYYSSFSDGSKDVHEGRLKVAISQTPTGPFAYVKDMCAPFSIDAEVVRNESGLYMFYSLNNYESERMGTYIAVDKMNDPLTLGGRPVPVVNPTLKEEIFLKNRFGDGRDWYTVEGACYVRQGNTHYLLYSGNCYESPNYFIGCAVATGGDDLTKLRFTKYPDNDTYAPLLKAGGGEEGTGHNSVIHEDGQTYIIYHARDEDVENTHDRRTARAAVFQVQGTRPVIKRL